MLGLWVSTCSLWKSSLIPTVLKAACVAMIFSIHVNAQNTAKDDAIAAGRIVEASHSTMTVQVERTNFQTGQPVWAALTFIPRAGWHTYWKNPGDSGAQTILDWSSDANGVSFGKALYPAPALLPVGSLMNYGYKAPVTLLVPIYFTAAAVANDVQIKLAVEWLVCEMECVPQTATLKLALPKGAGDYNESLREVFTNARAAIPDENYFGGSLTVTQNHSNLLVYMTRDEQAAVVSAYYFPRYEGVLHYAAAQQMERTDKGLLLSMMRSEALPEPASPNGLLVLTKSNGQRQAIAMTPMLNMKATSVHDVQNVAIIDATISPSSSIPMLDLIFMALAGGIILNLMPCVFPVLSLKALSLVKSSHISQRDRRREGWAYTAGIVTSFCLIVFVLLAIRSSGIAIGWGFQLQEPLFVASLVVLMVVVAMSLMGTVHISTGFDGAGQSFTQAGGVKGSFFTGVLATLVATPCTAPFMAPAIGYALTQDILTIFVIFIMLGIGLALPFLALAYSDRLAGMMPRPGAWMETFKIALSFPMLLTAAWLLYVFQSQTNPGAMFGLLVAVIIIAFALWLRERIEHSLGRNVAALVIIFGVVVSFLYYTPMHFSGRTVDTQTQLDTVKYDATALNDLRAEGKPVFLYFTAEWCITCKINEKLVLYRSETQAAFADNGIIQMKGDWTNRDPEITKKIASFGYAGVPLYIFYPAGANTATVLPATLSIDIIKATIGSK